MKRKQIRILFEEFFKKTYQEAYGYTLAKTADMSATAEILKNSFAELYKGFDSNEQQKNERTQLYRIIQKNINVYTASLEETPVDSGKKYKRYKSLLEKELDAEIPPVLSKTELQGKLQNILNFVATYPLEYRRAFYLHYLFGFGFDKIAAELGIEVDDAGNYVYFLTKAIRTELTKGQVQEN